MEFSLNKVVGFMIGILVALALGFVAHTQFNGFENVFQSMVGQ